MGARFLADRAEDGGLLQTLGQLGQVFADLDAGQDRPNRLGFSLHLAARLWVERIEVAHAAAHEQIDHVLRLASASCALCRLQHWRGPWSGSDSQQGLCCAAEKTASIEFALMAVGLGIEQ